MNLTRTFPPEGVQPRMSSLTATGTFSADKAQAAIDQLYRGGGSPYAKFTREGLLPVNIDWTVAAVVDGESMTHNFTQAYKLEEFAIRE